MHRFVRALLAVVIGFAGVLLAAIPAAADVNDFTFDSLTVDYTLTRADDGTSRLRVVEEFVAVFPDTDENRGIRRQIPATYNGQPLRPHLVSITDENGAPRPSESEVDDGVFDIVSRADGYLHGRQTYVITYTLENVTWTFRDTGLEFYWDVNGVDWAQPFGQVTARLHLDAGLAAALTGELSCYQGPQRSTTPCASITSEPAPGGDTVVTAHAEDLLPHSTLTMAVGFAPGTFTAFDASPLASPWGWVQVFGTVGLLGGGVTAIVARRRLRDQPGRPTIIAEYTPPSGIDALESAVLLGRTTKAIPAEVLEQAVVGSIRIVEDKKTRLGRPRLTAELVDSSLADKDGRMLLSALFPGDAPGETYRFGKSDDGLATSAQRILSGAEENLKRRGLRAPVPRGTRAWPLVAVGATGLVVVLAGIVAMASSVSPTFPAIMLGLAVAMMVGVPLLLARRPLSATGAQTRDHLRGLEQFISWAEADRIRMLQSPAGAERVRIDASDPRQKLHLYETLLPYAVVFGQEKQWSKELAVLYTAVGAAGPVWYYGTGGFDASSFSSGIGSLSAAATSSSSTSGGSSGGGSAGGGGGGGGGGGV